MLTWLITVGLIFALLLCGIGVERLYRRFAARHPQLGPYRKAGSCCGGNCGKGECSG